MSDDAFAHLPELRGRVRPAERSELRVTPEVLAFWDERARRLGRPANWRLPEVEIEASRHAVIGGLCRAGAAVWVFAYGSLMWDPGFHFAEVRRADLHGWQRRFTYRSTMGRGSPDRPGLMLTLESRAGCCQGLAYRIDPGLADAETAILWRREMIRGGYVPRLQTVATPQGEVAALVFTVNPAHPDYVGEQPLADTAATIASAEGPIGRNRDYLLQLAAQLELLAVEDGYVGELVSRLRELG